MNSLLLQGEWRVIDQTVEGLYVSPLHSFAMDDTLCHSVGHQKSIPVIRSWVHRDTIVLGIQDCRLPYIKDGIRFCQSHGFNVIVRNSGGLAVMLDAGILNLSIILPEDQGIDINRGYDAMASLVKGALLRYQVNVEAKEIVGSYCPGSYDLSINNKKFAGISQRRLRSGVAVQIYLCATKSGSARASFIQEFYKMASRQEKTKFTYPHIDPSTMASLSELLGESMDASSLFDKLVAALKDVGNTLVPSHLADEELGLFSGYQERIEKRNEKALNLIV
jgi:octanoyl-[GcvH]:protein N-octanoyltransferase